MNIPLNTLVGKTITKIEGGKTDAEITFHTSDGKRFRMEHFQDCCESVSVEDVCGDLNDLIGTPIVKAEESTGGYADTPKDHKFEYEPDSITWTFYHLSSQRGTVTIRWLGESNGYYGESVDFHEI